VCPNLTQIGFELIRPEVGRVDSTLSGLGMIELGLSSSLLNLMWIRVDLNTPLKST